MWTETHVLGLLFVLVGLFAIGCIYLYEFDSGELDSYGKPGHKPSPFHVTDDGKAFMVGALFSLGLGIWLMAQAWVPTKRRKDQEPSKSPAQQQGKPKL